MDKTKELFLNKNGKDWSLFTYSTRTNRRIEEIKSKWIKTFQKRMLGEEYPLSDRLLLINLQQGVHMASFLWRKWKDSLKKFDFSW